MPAWAASWWTLASDAVITSASTGATMTLAEVTAGATVRVKGAVTPGATTDDPVTVSATLVQVEPASADATTTVAVRGTGTVVSLSDTTLTLALTEASFLPSSATLVLDLASARYAHGTAADLVAGATVNFRGKLSGSGSSSSVSASMIDVEGAASATERARRGAGQHVGHALHAVGHGGQRGHRRHLHRDRRRIEFGARSGGRHLHRRPERRDLARRQRELPGGRGQRACHRPACRHHLHRAHARGAGLQWHHQPLGRRTASLTPGHPGESGPIAG